MAKDVDLSSKEWRDIVFEGKNKDFGAYQLRKASEKRHNMAMIAVLIIIAIIAALAVLVNTVIATVEARPEDEIEQALVEMGDAEEPEEELEEQKRVEPEQPVALPEEILNTVKMAQIKFVEDNQAEQIQSTEDINKTETAVGATNFDQGTDDLTHAVREHQNEVIVEEKPAAPPVDEHKVFDSVEQMPTFPGGEAALLQYIASHIRYPQTAADDGIQGRVVVRFVVTKTGSIGDVIVARPKHPDLDREAVRVVKSLPKFVPGKMNGHAVNVWYTLPVNFKLANQ